VLKWPLRYFAGSVATACVLLRFGLAVYLEQE